MTPPSSLSSKRTVLFSLIGFCLILTMLFMSYFNEFVPIAFLKRENISIDAIVDHLTNCTIDDRSRQHSLLTALKSWSEFAKKHHIQYWLCFGTLLGYVHDQGFIPHDRDVDIALLSSETIKLVPFSNQNFSNDSYLLVHPQWSIVGYENRSYFRNLSINFVAPNARFYNRADDRHVDIWPVYEFSDPKSVGYLYEYDNGYDLIPFPRNWTFPLKRCRLSGIPVWCPNNPKPMMSRIYGPESLNGSHTVCRNGSWVRIDKN